MPWHLERVRQGSRRGWAIVTDATGEWHSDRPLPHEDALAQLRALEANAKPGEKSHPTR